MKTTTLVTPEDDCSYFYNLFYSKKQREEEEEEERMDPVTSGGGGGRRKRRRKSEEGSGSGSESEGEERFKKKNLTEILMTSLAMEQQEKVEEAEAERAAEEERAMFEAHHRRKTQALIEFKSDSETHFREMNEADRSKRKRSRAAAAAVVSTVAVAAQEEVVKGKNNGTGTTSQHRRLWVKDRSNAWWDECCKPDFPEEEFKKAFRMGKQTFDLICDELKLHVAKEDTTLRNAIPVPQRVAVCIWRLATGEPLRVVSKKFGLGISTCHKLVLEVCSAIKTVLMPKYLQWPDEETLRLMKDEFQAISGIPNVVGSMYTTHVPIIAPKISVAAYFNKRHTERNQKTSYSITVQGVVNHRGVFTDVCIGWPGSMPDDQVLEKSALYQRASGGLLNGVWVVGGSGYPLMDWVLVPYTQQKLTWGQHDFNKKIGDIQRISRDAFARLKGRWSCLQKRTEVKLQDLPVVLGACCVLHNICEIRNEEMHPDQIYELFDDPMVPEIPLRSMSSKNTRDAIAHNLLHHGRAVTPFL
ncbi:hypothetical protein QQ045_004633 [Rhodiola kirilowii]